MQRSLLLRVKNLSSNFSHNSYGKRWWDHFYWEFQIVQICYCLNLKWLWTYWLLVDIYWCRKWHGSKLLILQPPNLLDCSPTAVSNSTQDYFFQFLFELWSLQSCKHTLSNPGSYYSHCMLDIIYHFTLKKLWWCFFFTKKLLPDLKETITQLQGPNQHKKACLMSLFLASLSQLNNIFEFLRQNN